MKIAEKVTIDRANKRVLIDGVEFPYYLGRSGPTVENIATIHEMPVVYLPVIALDVEVLPGECREDKTGDQTVNITVDVKDEDASARARQASFMAGLQRAAR